MSSPLTQLENVRVASPCGQSWDQMPGDDHCRFCSACGKNVYNLSAMTAAEGDDLIREKEGKVCVRFYRRRDGTILSANCPVGMCAMRRALVAQCGALALIFALIPGAAAALHRSNWENWPIWDQPGFARVAFRLGIRRTVTMGLVAPTSMPVLPSD
jgi:hypothetical protein